MGAPATIPEDLHCPSMTPNLKMLPSLAASLLTCLPLHAQPKENGADDFREEAMHALHALPAHGYPYGTPVLLKDFPMLWRNDIPTDTAISRSRESVDVDTMSTFVYQDLAASGRYSVPAENVLSRRIFPPECLHKLGLDPIAKTASLMVLKIEEEAEIAVYSAIAQQDVPCSTCEYQPRQLVNMLFVVSGNKIVSHLPIAYVKGDDLERRERYFYISGHDSIVFKDFSGDESNGRFLKEERWHIAPEGFFREDP